MSDSSLEQEPRWPAVLALLAIGGLHLALPQELSFGPRWLLLTAVVVLLVPAIYARKTKRHRINRIFGNVVTAVVTADMIWSLMLLLDALPMYKNGPITLLRSAAALWVTNILVFASWYWQLDAGGPNARDSRGPHVHGAFLFPQMILTAQAKVSMGEQHWTPGFIDYLFLAFTSSTAFSPTDTPVLSRWAKFMMMMQSLIAFSTVILVAARAVSII